MTNHNHARAFLLCIVVLTACTINIGSPGKQGENSTNGVDINVGSIESDRSPVKTEKRNLAPFTSIVAHGKGSFDITSGAEQSLSVEANEKSLSKVSTKVNGDILEISLQQNANPEHLNFIISAPHFKRLDFTGAITANAHGFDEETLLVELKGATTFNGAGQVSALDIRGSGAGTISARDLKSKNCTVLASGANTFDIYASDSVSVEANGASTVNVYGAPKKVKQNTSGASTINIQ